MRTKVTVLLVLALATIAAYASGAPWFKWMSVNDRTIICSQLSPGETYVKYQGPFMESRCSKPGNPQ